MLPEFQQYQQTINSIQGIARPIVTEDGLVDSFMLHNKTELVARGIHPLDIIARDKRLRTFIDYAPIRWAVEEGIPSIEQAIERGDQKLLKTTIQRALEFSPIDLKTQRITYSGFEAAGVAIEDITLSKRLRQLRIPYVTKQHSPLSIHDMPQEIRMLKTMKPSTILSMVWYDAAFSRIQAKLTKTPCVVSVFIGSNSMSYHGVGVEVIPGKIRYSFVTDIISEGTTDKTSPDEIRANSFPQFSIWEDVMKYSDISQAYQLNNEAAWYPEFWLEWTHGVRRVIVRPYESWVSNGVITGADIDYDNNRALAAHLLSKSLGNVPIEVLE